MTREDRERPEVTVSDPNPPAPAPAVELPPVNRDELIANGWPAVLADATQRQGQFSAVVLHLGVVRFAMARPTAAGWLYLGAAEVAGEEWAERFGRVIECRLEDVRNVSELE